MEALASCFVDTVVASRGTQHFLLGVFSDSVSHVRSLDTCTIALRSSARSKREGSLSMAI